MTLVGVIGGGYVGLTTAACLSSLGHHVVCAEADPDRLAALLAGEVPFHEDGLASLIAEGAMAGRLRFVESALEAVEGCEAVFLCVATPQGADGAPDTTQVESVLRAIRSSLAPDCVVVSKSTMPIGSCERLESLLDRTDVALVSNPEFLREGSAVRDFLSPERIVIGSTHAAAARRIEALYSGIDAPVVHTDPVSAQTIKYASNAMLAVRLSMVNALAALCDETGANIDEVLAGIGLDRRIGTSYLQPGPGWGGSCLPKDTQALVRTARDVGVDLGVVEAAISTNATQAERIADKVRSLVGGVLSGRTVALWGLAFKAHTDDLRDSPAVAVARVLIEHGASVRAYDPMVPVTRVHASLTGIEIADSADGVAKEADCLVVLTEWPEFGSYPPERLATVMSKRAVVDARNSLVPGKWRAAGFDYVGLGRR